MSRARFWKRFNKTICKLFRAGAGYFRTVRKCVKGGYSLSRKRVSPFATPERKDEGPSPSTPHIASLQLEELQRLPNRVRCTWLRHESLRVVTNRNRAFYREARVTFAWRRTACGMRHCCARRIVETGGRRELGCTATRLAEQQRTIEAEASRIAEPMAVSVSNTATQAVAFRRQKAPSSPRLPVKSLSLGGQRGIFSFRGKRISPLTASPARPLGISKGFLSL